MLSQVRGAVTGVGKFIVVPLLIAAFAFFGVPSLSQFSDNAAVKVGSERYSSNYVLNEFNRAVQARRAEIGGNYAQPDAIAEGLHTQTINSIVSRSALDQFSQKLGLEIPRESVRHYLQNNESFQNPATGKFDRLVLESILQRNGISVSEFEARIAEDLNRNQLVAALAANNQAPLAMVDALLMRETEKRKISYLTVTNEMAGVAKEPTPPDLQQYYDENPDAFTAPEFRTFSLLVMRRDDFSENLSVPEEELQKLYEINKVRLYDKPERRTIYQITYDSETEANAAVASLRQGDAFDSLAIARGQTLESLTFADIQQGDVLDPSVGEAAFETGLEAGTILDPIQSLFGFTVVQIAAITPAETREYADVRDELEAEFFSNDTRRALLNAIDEIELERDTGASLLLAAEAANFEVQNVGPVDQFSFGPGGIIVGDIPGEAIEEAFKLDEGEESEAIELSDGEGYFFVALDEVTPPTLLPFADVKDEVEDAWRKDERNARLTKTVDDAIVALKAGQTLAEVSGQFDRAPISESISRQFENEVISSSFTEELFSAALGEWLTADTAIGSSKVLAVIDNVEINGSSITADQQSIYRQYLGFQIDQELLETFVTAARDDLGVTLSQSKLDAIFGEGQ